MKTSNYRQRPQQARPARKKNGKTDSIKMDQLVQKANPQPIASYESKRMYSELPLHPNLHKALHAKGYLKPSEIQDKAIEPIIEGRDLLGIAQTGTGKTAAFLIPIINDLLDDPRPFSSLVLVPTRELAIQVYDEFASMSRKTPLRAVFFIGGTNIQTDLRALRQPKHVVIATPGRLLDLVSRGAIYLDDFDTLVIDEFDRMLDMGFAKDVFRIVNGMSNREQNLLFSATLDSSQQELIDKILVDPVKVQVSSGKSSSENVDQDVFQLLEGQDKFEELCKLFAQYQNEKVLVFDETKHRVNRLCQKLNKRGIRAEQIHGNKSQNARQTALNNFKSGKVNILVATDVAARGIDVDDISLVINYQVPASMDTYIHRIGRTGRAGKTGKAITFVEQGR
jgi:ATP-dependent RNA helicase RhlE